MLILSSTSDKLEVVTDAAVTVDVHASYVDWNGTSATPGRKNTDISTATTTDVTGSPAASQYRNVKTLTVKNSHASSPVGITLQHTDGTIVADLQKVTLLAGEALVYDEGSGFRHLDVNGVEKDPTALIVVKQLQSDQSNSTTTPTEVTGLSLVLDPGTYLFEYYLIYQAAATTTGVRFSVNHSGTVTAFVASVRWNDVSATASTAAPDQDQILATGAVVGSFAARAKSTAGWGTTVSVDSAAANMMMIIEGIMVVTVSGEIELWHGSEVAAASTVKAGSALRVTKIG